MIRPVAIIVFGAVGLNVAACSQDQVQDVPTDVDRDIAREIEQGAPTESTGLESAVLGAIPLDAYPATLAGGSLRAREVVLLPGAKIRVHAHHQWPALVYVVEGEVVEHRNDSEGPLIRRQGDTYFEGHGVVHWLENNSPDIARAFSVDIVPPQTAGR